MAKLSEFEPTTKRPRSQIDKRFTYHLKRLATKKVGVIREIYDACKPTKRDISRGCVGAHLVYNRYLAAKFLLEMADAEQGIETAKLNLYLDRTEGKVADLHNINILDVNKEIERLEAARQRVLAAHNSVTHTFQATDYKLLTEHALDQQSSAGMEINARPAPRGDAQRVPYPSGSDETPTPEEET